MIEEGRRPADLGEEEHNNLENDEQTIDDCPKHTGWLVWNGTSS